jgi:hypothetical protein
VIVKINRIQKEYEIINRILEEYEINTNRKPKRLRYFALPVNVPSTCWSKNSLKMDGDGSSCTRANGWK